MALFNNQRTATAALPSLVVGSTTTVTVTWPKPFLDTLYRVSAGFMDTGGGIYAFTRTATTKTGCTGTVKNIGTVITGTTGVLELTATHD